MDPRVNGSSVEVSILINLRNAKPITLSASTFKFHACFAPERICLILLKIAVKIKIISNHVRSHSTRNRGMGELTGIKFTLSERRGRDGNHVREYAKAPEERPKNLNNEVVTRPGRVPLPGPMPPGFWSPPAARDEVSRNWR